MDFNEITSEIVKCAIENKAITFDLRSSVDIEEKNKFNATQISEFYKTIFNAVSHPK